MRDSDVIRFLLDSFRKMSVFSFYIKIMIEKHIHKMASENTFFRDEINTSLICLCAFLKAFFGKNINIKQ